jgi:predicted RNA-binding Zn-ribbon protein involved in translation (DUF1610 family)
MSASAHVLEKFVLPIITCPACGSHMRLRTIVPEEYQRERMTFVCECGFDYRHSSAVTVERYPYVGPRVSRRSKTALDWLR